MIDLSKTSKEKNVIDSFFYYMWNSWDKSECLEIFSQCNNRLLGEHIWNKWRYFCMERGSGGAVERLYCSLDDDCRALLVARALSQYNGKQLL